MDNVKTTEQINQSDIDGYERLDMMIERNTSFDKNMNVINYQKFVNQFIIDFNNFKETYFKNLTIIATGGHHEIVNLTDNNMWDYIIDKEVKKDNKLVNELNIFYYQMEEFVLDLRWWILKEQDIIDKEIEELGEKL